MPAAPPYNARMNTLEELARPLEDYEYDELDGFLLALGSDQAVQNMSELDGFVTAIVSGPEAIPPSEWLPVIWGGGEHDPGIESAADMERVVELVMRHLNTTAIMLMEDPESYEPYLMENVVKGKAYLVVDDWCIGYMKAVILRENQWFETEADMADMLSPIPLFTTDEGWDLLDRLADWHIAYLQKQVAPAARAAHAYWLSRREKFVPPKGLSVH